MSLKLEQNRRRNNLAISGTASLVIILVISILISVLAITVLLTQGNGNSNSTTSTGSSSSQLNSNVTVFGLVSTTGAGTHPTSMAFVNTTGGGIFTAQLVGNHYSIALPNHVTYNVSLRWAGNYTWQSGEIEIGQLPINMSSGSSMTQSYNVVEDTPNSVLTVSGSISWQIVSSFPGSVKFTAGDGEVFVGNVTQNKTFSVILPNIMTYQVEIGTITNATGMTEWYYAHELTIDTGTRITGLIVNLSL